ncbi:response regulator [Pseudomonas quasicaspiana]|uniref:response regulator n=1 Tax=Pseudomonas quasicaspiana TaxID=2829821 RepID=UPI0013DFDD37|nr:response regulator [Pseudomonas quasicaspiana]MCD5973088.1 response regulator [Pseudomonas quasicaspiana]
MVNEVYFNSPVNGFRKTMRILIVEDDPILALLNADALEDEGHEIIGPAYDEAEALRLARDFQVDIAFVDINLSGNEEGIKVANFLRNEHGIFSLFVTGQIVAARERGAESIGVLSKPYSLDDLAKAALIAGFWLAGQPANIPNPGALKIFNERSGPPRSFPQHSSRITTEHRPS